MHHCLQIPEIVSSIFEYLPYYEENNHDWDVIVQRKRHLLSVVKTCRTFRDVALPLMWRMLMSPVPLLLTMPYDLVQVETLNEGHSLYKPRRITFQRASRPDDWTRFNVYASFVKQLGSHVREEELWTDHILLDDIVIEELDLKRREGVLFPNLRSMAAGSKELPYMHLFLSPRLEALQLFVMGDQVEPLCTFLNQIRSSAPALKTLNIMQSILWNDDTSRLLRGKLGHHLRDLDLQEFACGWLSLTDDATKAILSMPSLRSLTIRKPVWKLAQLLESQPLKKPQLKAITIYSDIQPHGSNNVHSVLRMILPSKLNTFCVISESSTYNRSELTNLLCVAGSDCDPSSLTEFTLERTGVDFHNLHLFGPARTGIDYEMLRPLLPFSNIRKLCFTNHPFDLTDDEFKTFAMAWPRLEVLTFETDKSSDDNDNTEGLQTTLRGLVWIAIYCRRLMSLSYNFDERETNGNKAFLSPELLAKARGHGLSFLTVGVSFIDDASWISSVLNVVFPDIILLHFSKYERDPTNYDRWSRVLELFPSRVN